LKNRFLLPVFVLFIFVPVSVFAKVGVGGQFGFDLGRKPDSFASLSIRSDVSPWCVSLNAHFSNPIYDEFALSDTFTFSADDYFVNERLCQNVEFYVLWGISAGFYVDFGAADSDSKDFSFGTGSRFGGGLDFFFFHRHLELFLQAVWNPYLGIKKDDGEFGFLGKLDNFPCSVGIRFWN